MLHINGNITDVDMVPICSNISITCKIPRICLNYNSIYHITDQNTITEFCHNNSHYVTKSIFHCINKTIQAFCISDCTYAILYDNGEFVIQYCPYLESSSNNQMQQINNVKIISAQHEKISVLLYDNTVIVFEVYPKIKKINEYKQIKLENSPYCANFDINTIQYYPKYFLTRFFIFVVSIKYTINIKIPKYLLFIIANYLK